MCGILGIFNDNKANEKETNAIFKVKEALKIIKNRGKDMYGIANENDFDYQKKIDHLKLHSKETPNAIAHCLHSLVSFVPQPLISENSKNRFIVNCEIYNWEELNETYKLNAKNDAEMLFRLIEKKGKTSVQLTKILDELEGVYAFAFWDVKKRNVVLARDIIGVKPIWFSLSQKNKGTDSFAFSSEKKALEHLNYNEICELNPRKILVYNIKTKKGSRAYTLEVISKDDKILLIEFARRNQKCFEKSEKRFQNPVAILRQNQALRHIHKNQMT